MEGKKTLPVFSLSIASRLIAEGYVIDHTDINQNKRHLRVFYFRNTPGLIEDIQRIRKELFRCKSDVPTIAVYKLGLAQRLLVRGYYIHHLGKDRRNKGWPVYFFIDVPGLQEAIDEYFKEVDHAKW